MQLVTVPQLVAWAQGQIKADDSAQLVVDAVNAYVTSLPVAADLVVEGDGQVGGDKAGSVRLGTLMLAVRVHRRRNSPNGIEAMTGDAIAYVSRHDPDVSRFLELNAPSVG